MRAQFRKLDNIVARHRNNHRFVVDRIKDLPGFKLRPSHYPEGDLGWVIAAMLPDRRTRDGFAPRWLRRT